MVIDSSAIVAIFFNEPEREELLARLEVTERLCLSAATLVEVRIVLRASLGQDGIDRLSRFLETFAVKVIPFDERQAGIADEAFLRFGKGRHRARLNFGIVSAMRWRSRRGNRCSLKEKTSARPFCRG
jgi:ribonuclease VapC